jgi:hypothetical protein
VGLDAWRFGASRSPSCVRVRASCNSPLLQGLLGEGTVQVGGWVAWPSAWVFEHSEGPQCLPLPLPAAHSLHVCLTSVRAQPSMY